MDGGAKGQLQSLACGAQQGSPALPACFPGRCPPPPPGADGVPPPPPVGGPAEGGRPGGPGRGGPRGGRRSSGEPRSQYTSPPGVAWGSYEREPRAIVGVFSAVKSLLLAKNAATLSHLRPPTAHSESCSTPIVRAILLGWP